MQLTLSLKAPRLNPRTGNVISWFQKLLSSSTCTATVRLTLPVTIPSQLLAMTTEERVKRVRVLRKATEDDPLGWSDISGSPGGAVQV
jgi:hypothetical protein